MEFDSLDALARHLAAGAASVPDRTRQGLEAAARLFTDALRAEGVDARAESGAGAGNGTGAEIGARTGAEGVDGEAFVGVADPRAAAREFGAPELGLPPRPVVGAVLMNGLEAAGRLVGAAGLSGLAGLAGLAGRGPGQESEE